MPVSKNTRKKTKKKKGQSKRMGSRAQIVQILKESEALSKEYVKAIEHFNNTTFGENVTTEQKETAIGNMKAVENVVEDMRKYIDESKQVVEETVEKVKNKEMNHADANMQYAMLAVSGYEDLQVKPIEIVSKMHEALLILEDSHKPKQQ